MRLLYTTLLLSPFFLFPQISRAQTNRTDHQARFSLPVGRTGTEIHVDGALDEPVWQNAAMASNFWLKWPRDGAPAPAQTEVRCAYDDEYLYIAATCYDSTPRYVIQSLKRDVGFWDSDGFGVILDPSNAANNGWFFGVSAAGVQSEGLISAASDEIDMNWDNAWRAEVKSSATAWTAEFAIPLRILRFREGQTTWGINFVRNDLSNGVYSTWAHVPLQLNAEDLGWTGALHWESSPRRTKGSYNLIPYANTAISRDYEANEPWRIKPNAGIDAKVGIGSGLNLDLTLNSDFSQVEIDEQVVNLTRFDVQLPEKRTFFLENADLFGNFGIPPIRPFFSRSIGLDDDGNPLPILGGLRLSGNLGSDTRIGLMTMQTGRKHGNPARNSSALALSQRLFGRTTVSGYFLDREEFDGSEIMKDRYSRNAGLELLSISNNGKWMGWLTHHRSFKPGVSGHNWWGNAGGLYSTRRVKFLLDVLHMGENYYADMGFERRIENYDVLRDTTLRIGYNFIYNEFGYKFFPKQENSGLNYAEVGGEVFTVLNPDGTLNEFSTAVNLEMNFKNTSELTFSLRPNRANVPVSFSFDEEDDLTRCPPLPAAGYSFLSAAMEWTSDFRKPLFLSASAEMGRFYNGRQYNLGLQLTGRIRTIANIRLGATYNKLNFPTPYCDLELLNLTSRVEVFFSKKIWWTTFLQYNNQADNFNINSRLQWRFRPMSDVFVVYTDNYAVREWGQRNRALVVKVSYWW